MVQKISKCRFQPKNKGIAKYFTQNKLCKKTLCCPKTHNDFSAQNFGTQCFTWNNPHFLGCDKLSQSGKYGCDNTPQTIWQGCNATTQLLRKGCANKICQIFTVTQAYNLYRLKNSYCKCRYNICIYQIFSLFIFILNKKIFVQVGVYPLRG